MKNKLAILVLLVCLVTGVVRVTRTYGVFNETVDTPAHLAMGMEFLQYGTYTYEYLHPPLARILIALGPYVDGRRLQTHRDVVREGDGMIYQDGSALLHQDGKYERTLMLSRLGILPFFALLLIVTFLWARAWFGPGTAAFAVILLSSLPPVLGHAAIATLDLACAATASLAMFLFIRWTERPHSRGRAAAVGFAAGLAILTKLSAIAFLGAAFGAGYLWLRWRRNVRVQWSHMGLVGAALCGTLWAGYGYSIQALGPLWGPQPRVDRILADHPVLRPVWDAAMSTPLPLTEIVLGARDLARQNAAGLDSYALGEFRSTGWWFFFPLAIGVKTPMGFLMLAVAGFAVVLWRIRRETWPVALTAAFAVAILGVAMVSRINVGVRHILVLYPLLAILAGSFLARSFQFRPWYGAWMIPSALAVWMLSSSAAAHPDYLAYFNRLANDRPEHFLAESDLDWGQDLKRLSQRLRELGVMDVAIKYFGSALLDRAGLPMYRELDPKRPTGGYVAISAHYLYLQNAKDGSYGWLKQYKPVERVGKSIDLFYIPE